jgi:predicted Fe-Mo cluster-binding NifX family protein
MRIVIPVEEDKGVDSRLSEHFGRAPFFAVFELDKDGQILSQNAVPNDSEHFGGTGLPPDRILQLKPDAVITFGMGPNALIRFQEARVAVLRADSNMVKSVISSYSKDDLEELTEGCHDAHHKELTEGCHHAHHK